MAKFAIGMDYGLFSNPCMRPLFPFYSIINPYLAMVTPKFIW